MAKMLKVRWTGTPGKIYVVWGINHISPDLHNVYGPNTYINPPVSYAEAWYCIGIGLWNDITGKMVDLLKEDQKCIVFILYVEDILHLSRSFLTISSWFMQHKSEPATASLVGTPRTEN